MNTAARGIALAGVLLALSAVVLAAMGSHAVDLHEQPGLQKIWDTASVIHLFQAAALIGLAALLAIRNSPLLKWGAWSIVAGTVIFSGSLYLRVITGNPISGVTPAGGLVMMAGWGLVVLALLRKS